MFSKLQWVVLVAALCVVSACTTVTTVTPAGISSGAEPDRSLLGAWKVQVRDSDSSAEVYVFLMPAKDAGFRAVTVGWSDIPASRRTAADTDWWFADVVTGKVGEHAFLNVRPILNNGEPVPGNGIPNPFPYFPLRYTHEDDGSVKLFDWGNAETIREAIKTGRISGTNLQITADSTSLDAFLATEGERAFEIHYATLVPLTSPLAKPTRSD